MTRSAPLERHLLDFLDARRDEMIGVTAELVTIPSMNPPGDERKVVAALTGHIGRLGLPTPVVLADSPERPNLVTRLVGQRPGPTVMLCGHTDTKPVGEG